MGLNAAATQRTTLPSSVSTSGAAAALQVQSLIAQIRIYNPSYVYPIMRPSNSRTIEYTNVDVAALRAILRGYTSAQACVRDGVTVGRFIADQRGNVMIEPVGGRTTSSSETGRDTHTVYPNGSNYMRLNPLGHGQNGIPHGHGHQMGRGPLPNVSGQGASLDVHGNVVPRNSPQAHWPIN